MSRCFPFPPPAYLKRPDDSLIDDSIKIRLDLEKLNNDNQEKMDKKERKERKREKKREKKEKKEKKEKRRREKEEKLKESTTSHPSVCAIKVKLNSEVKEYKDVEKLQKGEDCDTEQLERSGITEELEQPVCSIQEPYSSDSSQSSKRKRVTELPSQDHGPAIRIRLPLRKHREPEESKQEFLVGSCSKSVEIADSLTRDTSRIERPLPGIKKAETPLHGNSASKVCKPFQNLVPVEAPAPAPTNERVDNESRRLESLYKSLLHIAPLTYESFEGLDQDWLFSSVKTEAKSASKKQKTDAFQCSKSLWPRAQYIPEVDMYALPYTVPF